MAGSKSDSAEKIVLDMFLGGVAYTPPATVWAVLSTQPYSDNVIGSSCNEVADGTGYARVAITNDLTEWPAAGGYGNSVKSNANDIVFPTATADWGDCQAVYIADSGTIGAGNISYGGDITLTAVGVGSSITVPAGTFLAYED